MSNFSISKTIEANRYDFCRLLWKAQYLCASADMERNVEFLNTINRAVDRREPIPSPGFLLAVKAGWEFMTKIRKLPAEQQTELREICREITEAMISYNRNPALRLKCFAQMN